MAKRTRLDIIAVGTVAVDYFLTVDRFSWHQEKRVAHRAEIFPGGTMGNYVCATARLGLKTGIVSIVGDDTFGRMLKLEFKKDRIDTTHFDLRGNRQTPLTVVLGDERNRRLLLIPPGLPLEVSDLDRAFLQRASLIHMHLFDLNVCYACADIAKGAKIVFSIDLELQRLKAANRKDLDKLLSLCDIVYCNKHALKYLTGLSSVKKAGRKLIEKGPERLIVTLGAEGGLGIDRNGEEYQVSPYSVPAVDPTGAGDAFAGACSFGYLMDWPMKVSMELASAASAMAITKLGARSRLPTIDQIVEFIYEERKKFRESQRIQHGQEIIQFLTSYEKKESTKRGGYIGKYSA